ncbi:post-GPI attachment to proteins factor 2 isoform X3 [Folsomia candida]|uniref:post-GPI attachment to proteins factor 2 isoform X3 n=1 Tax=Folsomia candida TaxID=158441 RepID=UPI000B9088E5|nr:post-GPI attachment to proteins factor 2 isoform X3 [Folsomia candida]
MITIVGVDDPEDPYYVQVGGNNGKEAGGLNETTRLVPWHVIRIPFRHFIKVVISLPLGAFIFCVFWALYTDYDRATTVLCTHDMNKPVRNYLPSLSAAIGDFQPSQQIWKACIIIHAPGRFLFASMYLTYLKKVIVPQNVKWAILACLFHVIEIIGLIGLTVVTSKHNLFVHAVNFGLFVVFSQLYMIILCMLLSGCRKVEMNRLEQRGLILKRILSKVAIICSVLLFVTYYRHESRCEEGMYTIFALLEYTVVLANIGFNGSAYWDFYDRIIVVDFFRPCKMPTYKYSWDY